MLLAVLNVLGQESAAPSPNGDQQSVAELLQHAQAGDAAAQYKLAVRYSSGNGVAKDDAVALTWFRKSAESGYALGQTSLGLIYREGNYGVKKDPEQAVDWFRRAANQGNASGQSELGFMYERGEGLPQDDQEAAKLYTLAAAQGLPVAQFDLAYMYESGKGVALDPLKALELYESAAMGIPTARHNLAVMYFSGKLVHKDLVLAYKWALLAISAEFVRIIEEGHPDDPEPRLGRALIFAQDVAKHMNKDEKKSARGMAEQWINSNRARLGEEPRLFPGSIEHLK
jgi:TPR repeat protein